MVDSDAPAAPPSDSLLKGRVALITGGARGIGFEIAKALALRGAKLAVNDLGCESNGSGADPQVVLKAKEELLQTGATIFTSSADASDEDAVHRMLSEIEEKLGTVDILVNNAGILRDESLFQLSVEDWDTVVRTHLRASFLCTRGVARSLRKARQGGSIINMTSTSGLLGGLGQLNESSAKAGIYGLTRSSSIELQKYRIRVNALSAIAKTRLTAHLPMFEKLGDTMSARHVAPAAVFLASSLSEDISGTVLSVAGGRISCLELCESAGRIKEGDDGVWTAEEIAQNYESISRR